MLELGETAPDFTAPSTEGEIRFHDWLGGRWGLLFSYPKAFTSVCGAELVDVARMRDRFESAGVRVAGLSFDTADDQRRFGEELSASESCPVQKVTQISDPDGKVAAMYGMVHPKVIDKLTVRTTYAIDPGRTIRLLSAGPPKLKRDFGAVLDSIKSMQETDAAQS